MAKRSGFVAGGVGLVIAAIAVIAVTASSGGTSTRSASTSGSQGSSSTYTAPPTTVAPAPAPAPAAVPAPASAVVHVAHDAILGDILVSGTGRTVYMFEKDMGTVTACTGGCATTWPAWMTGGAPTAGPGVNASLLGSAHGQVTYAGHLLYFFSGDTAPGTTNGIGIPSWDAISPSGMQVGH